MFIDGKESGLHVFMVQIRDENHKPIPGVTLGDLGPKMGDPVNDTGYMVLDNVKIPRTNLLARFHEVLPDGTIESQKVDPKMHYSTMMFARAIMVGTANARLTYAATIGIRYNAVRLQGFKDTRTK
jgi:acyl-CoA oxidase